MSRAEADAGRGGAQDLASKSMCAQVEEMNQHLQHMEHLLDRNQHRWRAHSSSAARAAPDPGRLARSSGCHPRS